MRIWDIPPDILCKKHLLGEHAELHAIWSILTQNKKGYSNHPETIRWKGKLRYLYDLHQNIIEEFNKRDINHNSDLDKKMAIGSSKQHVLINTIDKQIIILNKKNCLCRLNNIINKKCG